MTGLELPPRDTAATFNHHGDFTDPMLRAVAAKPKDLPLDADDLRWLGYADQELKRLRELLCLATSPGYAGGRPQYQEWERVTHGRHCVCSACAREDWTNPQIVGCGMHGSSCPPRYQPLGRPGEFIRRERCTPLERPTLCGCGATATLRTVVARKEKTGLDDDVHAHLCEACADRDRPGWRDA